MAITRTRMLNIGDKVSFHGSPWAREIDGVMTWVNPGDVAEVFEFHEAMPPIPGLTNSYGDPDEGIPAYVVVCFDNGVTAAVDGYSLQRGKFKRVQK